jgi:hypothetical protein
MAADFGLLVARYNTSAPTVSTNNELREVRIDSAGRLYVRPTDDRDASPRYFTDGEAVGTSDRGFVILGLNETDSNYQMLRVNNDGSLVVSMDAGTDASEAADKANLNFGEVALTSGTWILIQSITIPTGKLHLDGWSYSADKNTQFQVVLATAAGTPVRADITEILDTQITTSSRPSDHVSFNRALSRAGGTNVKLCIFAKQLQAGAAGAASSMLNVHKTT